tara:strand:- start:1192 stop:1614 length:423 start_codon:yes stop_codon:yes gene_type:complete
LIKVKNLKILIIESNYYESITKKLFSGAKNVVKKMKSEYTKITVPGALEIPVVLERYKEKYDGFIILGCVIRGETTHFELVQKITAFEIYKIVHKNKLALGFGLLTVENISQAKERADTKKKNVGGNAAHVCFKMIKQLK